MSLTFMSNTLKEHLAKEVLTIATCWKLKLTDETVMGFTDHDKDLNIDSVFYKSSSGFTKSSVILNSNLKSDNLEIYGVINSDEITEEDVLTGRYDFANIDIFLVNYQNPNQERMSLRSGTFSKVTLNEGRFIVEINSLLDKLDQSLVELYSPTCRAQFCDDKCKIDQSKFSEISTVTRVIDERRFEDINLINKKDGYYKHGIVKFNTFKGTVRDYRDSVITLFKPPSFAISVGDQYSILAGCDKTFSMCKNKFNNVINFRGEPHIHSQPNSMK